MKIPYFPFYRTVSVIAIISAIAFSGCESDKKSEKETSTYKYDSTTSELSNVMRQMLENSVEAREQAKEGQPVEIDWELFKKIKTAEPTKPDLKEGIYMLQSEQFLKSVDALRKSPEDPIVAYNVMVVNCLNCHTNRCPGPMPRIKKLEIANL